jgi:hypothetical protein
MSRIGHGPIGLQALLDALEAELLAASVEEVRDALCETGRARDAACREVRSVLNEAVASNKDERLEDEPVSVLPFGARIRSSLHRH